MSSDVLLIVIGVVFTYWAFNPVGGRGSREERLDRLVREAETCNSSAQVSKSEEQE